jgi:hypothetical protein
VSRRKPPPAPAGTQIDYQGILTQLATNERQEERLEAVYERLRQQARAARQALKQHAEHYRRSRRKLLGITGGGDSHGDQAQGA